MEQMQFIDLLREKENKSIELLKTFEPMAIELNPDWNSGKRIRPYKCAVYMPFRTALEWLAQSFMGEKDRITYINGEWEIEP